MSRCFGAVELKLRAGSALALVTIKKRSDFLRIRGGRRFAATGFVLETRPRPANSGGGEKARFGFTVTKALGNAVLRNRIRRRLRAAIVLLAPSLAKADHDYVLIARQGASERSFADLKKDLERAFQGVHHPREPRRNR